MKFNTTSEAVRRREKILLHEDGTWYRASHPGHPYFFGFWLEKVRPVRFLGFWFWKRLYSYMAIPHPEPLPDALRILNEGDPISVRGAMQEAQHA